MSSPNYVWEKMYVAVDCLCGDGQFKKRLENATVSGLIQLNDDDLSGELRDDLKYVLDWTKRNITEGHLQKEPNELERKMLIDKILHVLIETNNNI